MKKILVALALLPMIASASELSVGTFELSGDSNLGFRSSSSKLEAGGASATTDTTEFSLAATGLYYVTPNVAVGARVAYDNLEFKFPSGNKSGTAMLFLGPAAEVETSVAPKLSVFALGMVGYAHETLTSTGSPDETASGFGFGIEAGLKYFVVKSVSFNAALAYEWVKLSGDSVGGVTPKTTDSTFGVNVGLSVYFGGSDGGAHH